MMEVDWQQPISPDRKSTVDGNREVSTVETFVGAVPSSTLEHRTGLLLTILLAAFALSGCNSTTSGEVEKLSHHQPSYWPDDLMDAADKLEQRMARLEQVSPPSSVFVELAQIISWLPEIAADTDMPEREWQAIYDQSELLRKRLSGRTKPIESIAEIDMLVKTLRESGSTWKNRSPPPPTTNLHSLPSETSD